MLVLTSTFEVKSKSTDHSYYWLLMLPKISVHCVQMLLCNSLLNIVLAVIGGGVEGAGLVPWLGGPPDASFGFWEAFQSQTNMEKILYNKSH